jgi:nucleoside-triphosphatase
MPHNILITGRPGSGKTTLVKKLAEGLTAGGFKTAGFITEEIREGVRRVGFEVRDLGGGSAVLAHVDCRSKQRVGKYGVDVAAFERIALHAINVDRKEKDLLVIDEIGRMELFSSAFRSAITGLLDAPLPFLATVHSGKDAYLERVLSRKDIYTYNLTPANREGLLEVVYGQMNRVLTDS